MKVLSEPIQATTAGFELSGNAGAGDLRLLTPLGSTAAELRWTPTTAELIADGEVRQFDTLQSLVRVATGADLPISALFTWLRGENVSVPGWQVDLAALPQGRLIATRQAPAPVIELRIALQH